MQNLRAAKSLGDNRIGEYGILFGSQRLHDATPFKDYFTANTDFWLDKLDRRPMIYQHGVIGAAKFDANTRAALEENPVIGYWDKAEKDSFGVWMEGDLDTTHPAYSVMKSEVDAGSMMISSDCVLHLRLHKKNDDGTHELLRYPLFGASLTGNPAEKRMAPVNVLNVAMKSLGVDFEIPATAEEVPVVTTTAAAKSSVLGEHIEGSMTMAALERLFDAFRYNTIMDACMGENPLAERMDKVGAALDEVKTLTLQVMQAILSGASSESPAMAAKSLELQKLSRIANTPLVGLTQSDHSDAARETARTYVERMVGFAAKKSLENKALPDERVSEVGATVSVWEAAIAALKPLTVPLSAAAKSSEVNADSDGELSEIRRAHLARHAATA